MGKWITQRFFLIAGKLVSSGRRFILKLQEDWAYSEEYKEAEGRLERWAWITLQREAGKVKTKETMEESHSIARFILI